MHEDSEYNTVVGLCVLFPAIDGTRFNQHSYRPTMRTEIQTYEAFVCWVSCIPVALGHNKRYRTEDLWNKAVKVYSVQLAVAFGIRNYGYESSD